MEMLRIINERHARVQKVKRFKEDIKYALGVFAMALFIFVFLICTL